MCYTCGCRRPADTMGEPDKNITEDYFEKAGDADAIGKAGKKKAKQNMIELLQIELEKDELDKPREQY